MSIKPANGFFSRKTYSPWMLYSTAVFIVAFANFFLSVDAIRCHQCNSHVEEGCMELRMNNPRGPQVDTTFLKECESDTPESSFCRKTVFHIEATNEIRIIRGCGYINDRTERNNTCFEADNEGFKQMICACFEHGCNSAPPSAAAKFGGFLGMGLAGTSILLSSLILRRFA